MYDSLMRLAGVETDATSMAPSHGDVRPRGASVAAPRQDFANFDYIRLVAASAVIFSHSFLLAEGRDTNEPFVRLLGEKNILGLYGVFTFFVISGFLITRSASTSRSVRAFAWARMLRIYPALICCTIFCGVVLGSIFTTLPLVDFWTRLLPLNYAVWASLLPGSEGWSIPTVIFYRGGGWLAEGINGSLWTIPQEVHCYVIVGLLCAVRWLRWYIVAAICALCLPLILLPFPDVPKALGDFLFVAPSFAFGSLLYFLQSRRRLPLWPLLVCAGIAAGAIWAGKPLQLFPLYAAYPLICLATAQRFHLPSLRKFGDISYGMYLYGWPAEQVVRALLGEGAPWWAIFGMALPVAAILGFLSWHLLESRVLRFKKYRPVIAKDWDGPPQIRRVEHGIS
jgi:peptidoglycan/LPS O-acetylase OafA/YrhL